MLQSAKFAANLMKGDRTMCTRQNKISVRITTLAAALALAVAVLTGCQTHPYASLEDQVYNHFDPLTRKVPRGLIAAPKQDTGRGTHVYAYHDGRPGPVGSQSSRFIRCEIGAAHRELWVGDTLLPDKNKLAVIAFYARSAELTFGTDITAGMPAPCLVDELLMAQDRTRTVVYFKRKGTSVWAMCELEAVSAFTLSEQDRQACLEQAETVTAKQVQRFIDLAKRFYKTYFFLD